MFSAELKYVFEEAEKLDAAYKKLNEFAEKSDQENSFRYEFVVDEKNIIIKITAETSALLRQAMVDMFPVVESE